ncbi:tRNA(Ile)-lysidine synthetase [hydrothermal vent metagenome]|uniref:tRNA(Ile)-lysidine synthetase n=1 Tax=hydrothermal vent metagenome TaxID=652676 RepID=A0A1W1CC34_9ZZZZ
MINLTKETFPILQQNKNLLAFSAGVDSSALFFLLLEENIDFDIALVNYNLRENSIKEELHAIALAKEYNLKCYTIQAPSFENNFEKNARDFRYDFFDKIISENNYDNLLTAHQLNDQLEWFLMRLTKGAGTSELLGLEPVSKRKNYTIIRPLLHNSKEELLDYLELNNFPYFIDKSNFEEKYERNIFRKNFSDKLLTQYKEGIRRSFDYLREDKQNLFAGYKEVFHYKKMYVLSYQDDALITRLIDKYLKILGYLLSGNQRKELKRDSSIVFGGLWAVEIKDNFIYIAPYLKINMPKRFKEECRRAKLPSKIRAYLYKEEINPKALLG